jgi:signal transduction histidine kinase/HAMP domain-containing protein/CheY-like chemotaxis protein
VDVIQQAESSLSPPSRLTALERELDRVAAFLEAAAEGNLQSQLRADGFAAVGRVVNAANHLVARNAQLAREILRVSRRIASDGRLTERAAAALLPGIYGDALSAMNDVLEHLTWHAGETAAVARALEQGELSRTMPLDSPEGTPLRGQALRVARSMNGLVARLRAMRSEVIRIAGEVGTAGTLGGQAEVRGASGAWKEVIDAVNLLAANLTSQVRNIALVTTAVARGDLSRKITVPAQGEILELKETVNEMVDQLRAFSSEVTRVAREVGSEGKLGAQADVKGVSGVWKDLTDHVNILARNLTDQVRNIAKVTTAVANGDLSQKITVGAKGEVLALKSTINTMVDQLRSFGAEVTRVAKQVGTEGRLGAQADVPGVGGVWKDLTDNVNVLAGNLTDQVRGIALVTTAVARGDLSRKITVPAQGEILELKETVNEMVDQLRAFAAEVTRVAREVGTEGKLGGQARVPGVAGTWKDLTESVNTLAGNLTWQVRNIANVTTAVANGELSRKITVRARGEIRDLKSTVNGMVEQLRAFTAEVIRVTREVGAQGQLGSQAVVPGVAGIWKDLTDSINEMIVDLRESTQANEEQDWLNTNMARLSGMLQGRRSVEELGRIVLGELSPQISAQYAALFVADGSGALIRTSTYGDSGDASAQFRFGEGLVGQCALEKKILSVDDLPAGYVRIRSGIGQAAPRSLLVVPVLFEGEVKGVIELASLQRFKPMHRTLLEKLAEGIGVVLNTIATTSRTEQLLEKLKASNAELAKRTSDLEDKARQLALVSRYKTEFLANMSHELRTPLNSVIILARLLAENSKSNLDVEQVEYASTIHSSGNDLLVLIDQILDLSKIESGRLQVEVGPVDLRAVAAALDRMFRPTLSAGIEFSVFVGPDVPAVVLTDAQRLQQVLKNLLANAFKFTPQGRVDLTVGIEPPDAHFTASGLRSAEDVLSFAVSDTGIGIPPEKHELIFEAFQQADTSTSRTFGGTGLGLTISRELARLLGGEIRLRSAPARGSTFTLYLPAMRPVHARAPAEMRAESAPVRQDTLAGRKVLLVDDDVHNLFAVTSLLERHGVRVLPAASALDCYKLLDENDDVDVVLMDVMMPEIDGLTATQAIRKRPACAELPIVALTAKALPGDRERCLEAGCSDFATKPIQPETLVELLLKWVAQRGTRG